jgi:hypothetical protein
MSPTKSSAFFEPRTQITGRCHVPRIRDDQLMSAAAAPQQAGQQRLLMVGGSCSLPTMIVPRNRPLVLLEFAPS